MVKKNIISYKWFETYSSVPTKFLSSSFIKRGISIFFSNFFQITEKTSHLISVSFINYFDIKAELSACSTLMKEREIPCCRQV